MILKNKWLVLLFKPEQMQDRKQNADCTSVRPNCTKRNVSCRFSSSYCHRAKEFDNRFIYLLNKGIVNSKAYVETKHFYSCRP